MLFVYLGHKTAVLILGEETCLKHFSSHTPWGSGRLFVFDRGGVRPAGFQYLQNAGAMFFIILTTVTCHFLSFEFVSDR